MTSNLIDAATAAEIAGVQTRTIWQYNRFGRMPKPVTYFGRSPAWERSEIEAWAKDKEDRKFAPEPADLGSET